MEGEIAKGIISFIFLYMCSHAFFVHEFIDQRSVHYLQQPPGGKVEGTRTFYPQYAFTFESGSFQVLLNAVRAVPKLQNRSPVIILKTTFGNYHRMTQPSEIW